MIREIVEVAEDTITLKLPLDLIGKKVEVIAFEIEEEKLNSLSSLTKTQESRLQEIHERYDKLPRISHEHYKFDRDEANNYD